MGGCVLVSIHGLDFMSCVFVVNAGSSSLKFAIFGATPRLPLRLKGLIEGIGAETRAKVMNAKSEVLSIEVQSQEGFDHTVATQTMIRIAAHWLEGEELSVVGHRVVHGGAQFTAPVRLSAEIVDRLAAFIPLAPLHQVHNLAIIRTLLTSHPDLPQVACFDTAFHASQPAIAQAFAIPRKYSEAGIRRYGFHGLSYKHVTDRLKEAAPEIAEGRVIIAHLGNGASLCAIKGGKSVASTMGFTAADGLMMGTRCGALDPGVLVHMMDRYGMGARELEDLIYKKSGLLGVSNLSSDMRTLRASPDPAAAEAISLFVYRVQREVGSLAAALGGLDALVFTAGIGANDAATRAEICEGCKWLGVELDTRANSRDEFKISNSASRVSVLVASTNEELEIAQSAYRIVSGGE
jgi:acetate kinase